MTMQVIHLTTYWTLDDAATVIDFLDVLREALWETYGESITRMHREMRDTRIQDINQCELKLDDDIPF
ncbi:hypothetical protein BMS3Abin12_00903 [bacterium BMS3Abin12]|nr:hypothetical protein BMS3Abin12_00903 [bacterium BMS3Abin12]GBE49227.1 hypothetical protein BMS3Bbin13_00143 [bacterium BMS3Bbin13]